MKAEMLGSMMKIECLVIFLLIAVHNCMHNNVLVCF